MGCFDSVNFECPNCHRLIEEQSKVDECLLINYDPFNIPENVAKDINGRQVICPNCRSYFRIACGTKLVYYASLI